MRRAAGILAAVLAVTALVAGLSAAGGTADGRRFTVELDNAFGLVEGGDVKVAGVRAGSIAGMRIDVRTRHALVDVVLDRDGYGSLRTDAFCESRPQSLIGEYFLDCRPGTSARRLADGARVPIAQTAATVPADLINDIMRRPYAQRFRIILNELGTGLAARGETLNAAIRRASPGLRETDRVLAILGRQNVVLRDLVTDADTVLRDLAGNRRDVTRWVRDAGHAASVSAERRRQIAQGLARLPAFLRELTPTMRELGRAADAQTPALADLDASAGRLNRLLTQLKPFTRSTRLNLRALGGAAKAGRPAIQAATPVVAELNRFSKDTPELANNLAIVLSDLDDRGRAVEKDPRSPGGQGYTGLEALLQYVFDQALAVNVFDTHGYVLKANLFVSECSDYQNADSLKAKLAEDPGFYKRCASILGATQPGVLQPDPTKTDATRARKRRAARPAERRSRTRRRPQHGSAPAPSAKVPPSAPGADPTPVDKLGEVVQDLLGGNVPDLPGVAPVGGVGRGDGGPVTATGQQDLLDFLLAP
jgi:ABC-type transporter Mla subunit MlaD